MHKYDHNNYSDDDDSEKTNINTMNELDA